MTERFPAVDIREVNLNKWQGDAQNGIPQRNTGMGEGRRIENQEVCTLMGGIVDAFNQFIFSVTLQKLQVMASCLGLRGQGLVNIIQGCRPVDTWLPGCPEDSGSGRAGQE